MTVWFALDGIDFAVTGERYKGYVTQMDRFDVKRVYMRSTTQNIKTALDKGFLARLSFRALEAAQHPVPIPYDMKGG